MQEKISYEELDALISAYQDGDADAAEQLVYHYDRYFQKFLNVLKYRFTITDKTQRGFARYFVRSEQARSNTHLYRRSDYIRRVLYATVVNIKERYQSVEADELKSEMVVLFLDMAAKHNFKAPFVIYMARFFPRKFYKVVRGLIRTDDSHNIYYDEEDVNLSYYDEYEEDKPRYFIQSTTSTEYDENWVNGYGCGEVFRDLTIYERRILKWYYEWKTFAKQDIDDDLALACRKRFKRTEEDIAGILGCSRKTINLKRNDVKRRVEALARELHLIQDNQSSSHI